MGKGRCGSCRRLWQPIETAPKDGTDLLLYVPAVDGEPAYQMTGNWDGDCWVDNARGSWRGFEPSHWQIVEPPSVQACEAEPCVCAQARLVNPAPGEIVMGGCSMSERQWQAIRQRCTGALALAE